MGGMNIIQRLVVYMKEQMDIRKVLSIIPWKTQPMLMPITIP